MPRDNGNFMYFFNRELTERDRIFKISSVVLKDNLLSVLFIVNADDYDKKLDDGLKNRVYDAARELVPEGFEIKIDYKKTVTEHDHIVQCMFKYIYDTTPMLFSKLNGDSVKTEVSYDSVTVTMTVSPMVFSFMKENNMEETLSDYLDTEIMESVNVILIKDTKEPDLGVYKRKTLQRAVQPLKVISINTRKSIVGEIAKMPRYISEVNHAASAVEAVCGKISNYTMRTAKTSGKPFFTFTLDDSTAKINVICFPYNQKQAETIDAHIADGVQIVAEGEIIEDARGGGFKLKTRRMALADIDYSTINTGINYLSESDEYVNVEPMPCEDSAQGNMFEGGLSSDDSEVPDNLKGDYVVFDLETTGIAPASCKILEIGAVKLHDGIMTETFSTLINPCCHIPEEASNVNHITDDMVSNCFTFEEVVGDFYKFTRGATLVAHNAPFDVGFIAFHAKKCSYNFDNDVVDTLKMSVDVYGGSKKHNLAALCKRLDIDLEGAHRAVNDAMATAEAFRKMCILLNNK